MPIPFLQQSGHFDDNQSEDTLLLPSDHWPIGNVCMSADKRNCCAFETVPSAAA